MRVNFINSKLFILAAGILIQSCNTAQEGKIFQEEEIIDYAYKKELIVQDEYGNHLVLMLSSDNEQIIDSYSQDNFTIKALTQSDIDEMKSKLSAEIEEIEFQEEDFEFDTDPVHIYQEVISKKLVDDFIAIELTVDWKSPDNFENRGFDWHSMGRSNAPNVYGNLTNNRCCWAIYYSYYFIQSNGVRQKMISNAKLKGGDQATAIGLQQVQSNGLPYAVEIEVKFRKQKHYSFYYFQ